MSDAKEIKSAVSITFFEFSDGRNAELTQLREDRRAQG